MKKITLLLLLFSMQLFFAQIDKISLEIESIVLSRTEKPEDLKSVKKFFENFSAAKPAEIGDVLRDFVGICFKSAVDKSFSLIPAKYSIDSPSETSRTSYFNLNPIEKPIAEVNSDDYLKLFQENSKTISDNDYFMNLKYADSDKKGTRVNIKDEMIIGDTEFLSILKVKDQKIYAISF